MSSEFQPVPACKSSCPSGSRFKIAANSASSVWPTRSDGLVEQRFQIVARQGELSERGDDRLFQRAVEQNFFRPFTFGIPLLQ